VDAQSCGSVNRHISLEIRPVTITRQAAAQIYRWDNDSFQVIAYRWDGRVTALFCSPTTDWTTAFAIVSMRG
jgi:hypothetical protein